MMSIWALANDRVRFADLPLTLSPNDIVEQLQQKGMRLVVDDQAPNTYRLTGQLAGLKVDADLHYTRDSMRVNYLRLSTRTAARSVLEDYRVVMQWMEKHYGKPTWESTVRSHPFARWFVDFDQDIVVIVTAKSTVEVWFYNNHLQRHFDYYSILKYCERNPVENAPNLTARESVTWRSATTPSAKKKPSKRHLRKKASKRSSRKGNRAKHRRQRRNR